MPDLRTPGAFAPVFPWRRDSYTADDLRQLRDLLRRSNTFDFPALPNGLFPAAHLRAEAQYTGYSHVWVRDNIHVAHALLAVGEAAVACRTVRALLEYFGRHRYRFEAIIDGRADPAVPMNRPHIRFDGNTLREVAEDWSHAQNDALGYLLWLASRLHLAGAMALTAGETDLLSLFPAYFRAIRYWEDRDSGHWEEKRKVEASSIGAVVAGLEAFRQVLPSPDGAVPLDPLIAAGRDALQRILPWESIDGENAREYDSALLFLIWPLDVADASQRERILAGVETMLGGEAGVRRYLGDSFWCADYDLLVAEEQRTANVSEQMSVRDALMKPSQEAQWCIFDPVLSVIYGRKFLAGGARHDHEKQVHHFNRALAQLARREDAPESWLCPELYYLRRGRWEPNDVTPLLWTAANLMVALHVMQQTAGRQAAGKEDQGTAP